MKRNDTFSLMSRIFKILIAGFVIFGIALLVEIVSISMQLRKEVIRQNYEILNMQIHNLDEWLLKEENDLVSWNMSDVNIQRLKDCTNKNEAERIVARIRALFADNMNRRSLCEFYFVVKEIDGKRVSGLAVNGDFSALDKSFLEQFAVKSDLSGVEDDYRWQLLWIGERWYYFYFQQAEGVLMGQAVSLEKLFDYIGMQDGENKNLGVHADGQLLFNGQTAVQGEIVEELMRNELWENGSIRKNRLVLSKTSARLDHDFFYVQEDVFTENYMRVIIMLYGSVIFISFAYLMIAGIAFKNLRNPVNIIKKAMLEVRKGKMETKIEDSEKLPIEFREVAQVFNDMMQQIKNFKISSYENEIEKKNYEIQYLALQIEPHFYLNAMKGLYALAQQKKYAKMQELILDLAGYFRYLTYNREHQVTLLEEINHVKRYLNILRLESSKPIHAQLELDGRANDIRVPKLMIQTFIENSFKYASAEDRELEIEIKITVIGTEEEYLLLSVADNGNGFPGEVLHNRTGKKDKEEDGRVGLKNLYHRLRLLYGDKAYMNLSNKENGGASAEVMIPGNSPEHERAPG